MPPSVLSTQFALLLILVVTLACVDLSRSARSLDSFGDDAALTADNEVQQHRRAHDLKALRHFLLTSNTEQRADKRAQQDTRKRELVSPRSISFAPTTSRFVLQIQEYLRSIEKSDLEQQQDVRSKFQFASLSGLPIRIASSSSDSLSLSASTNASTLTHSLI